MLLLQVKFHAQRQHCCAYGRVVTTGNAEWNRIAPEFPNLQKDGGSQELENFQTSFRKLFFPFDFLLEFQENFFI